MTSLKNLRSLGWGLWWAWISLTNLTIVILIFMICVFFSNVINFCWFYLNDCWTQPSKNYVLYERVDRGFFFFTLTNDLNCFTINTQLISHIPTLYITFCCVFLFTLTIIIFIHSSCIRVFLSLCLLWLCMWCVRLCRHSQLKKTCWSLYILLLLRGNIQIQRYKTKNYRNVPMNRTWISNG